MFIGIFILLLATFKLAATDKCERIDWLQPFSNASDFFCYSNGWFPDKTDYDCRRYFVCIKNSENFIRIYLSCPVGTYFNPHVISCTKDYVCPYHLTTTTTATTNRTTTEEMQQSRFSNLCLYKTNLNHFKCKTSGRFPNYNDLTCGSYFHCINVIFPILILKTKLNCGPATYFNPDTKLCEIDYVCPCNNNLTTNNGDSLYSDTTMSLSPAIIESTTMYQPSVVSTTNTETVSKRTSYYITESTSIDECFFNSDPNYFTCTVEGRFRNANDKTCQTYFLCNILSSGRVIQTKYSCPTNSYFNPEKQLCDADYDCPCSSSETTTTEVITTQEMTEITTERVKTDIIEGTTEEMITEDDDIKTTIGNTTESTSTLKVSTDTTSIDECFFNSDPNYFTCTVKGRFRNANDKTCQTYFWCYILSSGRVIQTKYSCPTNSYFNPEKQLCHADYDCPCSSSETTTTEVTSTQEMTEITTERVKTVIIEGTTEEMITEDDDIKTTIGNTTESTSTLKVSTDTTSIDECFFNSDPNYFTCTVKGRFRNANDKTCQTYFWCYILSSGRVIQTKYSCPTNSYFNPEKQLCHADYDCPCSSSETTTTEVITTQEMTEITTERVKTDIIEGTTEEMITEDDDIKTTIGNTTESTSTLDVSTDTTSIDECSFNSDPNYFTCTVQGRFRNANDKTCQTYFWCYILSSGRVIQTKYSCPTNSYFNPEKQLCDADYDCPCSSSETTTTEVTSTQEMTEITTERVKTVIIEGTTEEMITEDDDIKTTIGNTTESTSTLKVSTDTTSIDECSFNSDPNYFTCTVQGRFRNANDKTCQTYFWCYILSSGRVIQTKYSCPTNSYFNPEKQLCDADYDCPCSSSETTTTEVTSTQEMTEITTERVKTVIIEGTTEEMITEDDDIKTTIGNTTESTSTLKVSTDTTSIDECSFNSDPNYFTCTVQGRFRNANDKTCQTYFWCYILSSGRVIQTKYSCPTNSYFNPEKQLCDADYDCPCSSSETTTTEVTSTQEMTEITTERVKTVIIEGTTEEMITEDDDIKTTIGNTTESTSTLKVSTDTTSIDECFFNSDPNYFTCTVKGRFRNANDKTCQTYFLCNILSSGRVIQTKYSCPTNSYFNPEKQLCDADYDCPCSSSETTTTEVTSTQEMTEITTERVKTVIIEGTTEEMITEDDDIKTTIGNTTESTSTLDVSTDTTSIDECSFNSDPNYFTCTVQGRFRNANDKTCQTYFWCYILSSGRVIQTKYSCPTNSYFNPEKQLCDADYDCPCSSSETTTTEVTSTQEMTEITTERVKTVIIEGTTEEMITEDDDIKTTIGNTTESTSTLKVSTDTTSIDECFFNSDPNYFTCTVKGRFRNANDKTCQTYFLCNILSSGRVIQTKYSCPTNSYFNPEKQLCDADYDCPCSSSETTTTEVTSTQEMTEITTERVKTVIIEGTTEEMITEDDDIKTTIGNTTESTSTLDVSTDTTSIDECSFNSDPNYFTCTVQGRFRNANDKTCQTYFWCYILSSGRVIQTKYSCPTNSYFNPEKQLCDADYDCPCSSSETTTTEVTSTQEMTEITTERVKTVIIEGTTEEMITEDDDIKTTIGNTTESTSTLKVSTDTTSIDECFFNSDPNYFTCTVKGRFRNANDKTCQTYFWCYILSSGRVIQTKYSCPTNSYFNPEKQLCHADYDCPCSSSETTTTEVTSTQEMTEITTERVKTVIIEGTTEEMITEDDDIKTTIGNTTEPTSTLDVATDTTSIDECSFNSDPNYFTCTVKGRFRNANDTTCQTYFLCNILSSGRVIQTKYSCPTNSYFNPEKQLCDADYDCPCSSSETTTTEVITTQEMTEITTERVNTDIIEGTTEEMITEDDDIKTTIGNTTEPTSTLDVSTDTTSIDECSFNSDPNYFTCTVKGRFRNANDKTCQSYFLCNILSSGRVIQTKYSCPTNSYFNPEKQLCDADYDCPCSSSETTTTEVITTQEMTEITTERVNTDIIEGTTEEMITEDDDIKTTIGNTTESTSTLGVSTDTTSIDECSFNSDPNYFTCTVKGRFRNANDKTCQTYFLCNILSSGRVIQTKYSCPTNSYFNPEKQLCDADYDCPCSSSETTTTEVTSTQEMTEITTERVKTVIIEGTTEEMITEDDDIKTTIGNTTESTSTLGVSTDTTSIDECSFNSDPNYFTCTVKGRFRNANDKTCQTYFLCNILSSGRVIQTKYSCPTNSYFNPEKQLCDADYDCPCSSSETTTTEVTSTQEMTEITTERVKTVIIEGTTEEMITEDDDIKTTIGNTTESTSTLGVSTDTTSIDECSFNSDPNYFTCTVKGRFRNANDKTCQTYFLCNILSSGRVIQTKYSCPTNSYFNPEKQLCDADYDCPCSSSETTTTEVTSTQEMTEITTERVKTVIIEGTTEEMITEDDDIKTTIGNTTESTSTLGVSTDTTSIDECSFNSDPNYFTCTVKGRFRNANDKTCQTYFLCNILSSGRVIQTKYSCPTNSYFNPEKQLCDADYDCPCSSSETTTTEVTSTQEMTEITTERVKTVIIEGTTEEMITEDDDIKTTIGNTTESTSTLKVSTDTTSIDECFFNSDPNYFTCTVQGRFRNANDKTCQTYFLCNILSNGRVIQTKYSCPTNSYFNPEKQLCDADYKCQCSS